MIEPQPPRAKDLPHPVVFDVEYPERLSRGLIFIKWLLVIPQAIIAYLLMSVLGLLAVVAWFAVLFTGKYPRSMFDFGVGAQRWAGNVFAYYGLLRDEYPPFSFEPGDYPLTLDIPYTEQQSRWRLFIRIFAIIPNQIIFAFVTLAWLLTSFIAWWAILITGRYPRGLFNFSVGVMRWWHRQTAYYYVMRDEYPPYSTRADAKPGNEVASAIIGAPLFVAYVGFYIAFSILPLLQGGETVRVDRALLSDPGAFAVAQPSADSGSIRVTLVGLAGQRPCEGRSALGEESSGVCSGFSVRFEKDGFLPAFYTPYLFSATICQGSDSDSEPLEARFSTRDVTGEQFRIFVRDGSAESTVYFALGGSSYCALEYFTGSGTIRFEFR